MSLRGPSHRNHAAAATAMDAFELFKKLGAGAKFDLKRFGQDAARFKVLMISLVNQNNAGRKLMATADASNDLRFFSLFLFLLFDGLLQFKAII